MNRFDVMPQVLCRGDKAIVTWDVSGTPTVTFQLQRGVNQDEQCRSSGQETYELTMVARRGNDEAIRKVGIVQLDSVVAEPIVLRTTAVDGNEVVATGEKNVSLWTGRVEVLTISACGGRDITVQHDGKTVAVAAGGEPSSGLAGTSLSGEWIIRAKMSDDEVRTPASRPKLLKAIVAARCKEPQ